MFVVRRDKLLSVLRRSAFSFRVTWNDWTVFNWRNSVDVHWPHVFDMSVRWKQGSRIYFVGFLHHDHLLFVINISRRKPETFPKFVYTKMRNVYKKKKSRVAFYKYFRNFYFYTRFHNIANFTTRHANKDKQISNHGWWIVDTEGNQVNLITSQKKKTLNPSIRKDKCK